MQLFFIRHGQSVNNAHWNDPNYQESPDPILTETGKQQAQILGEYLEKLQPIAEHKDWNANNHHGFGITHIYTSLMERAVHTASFVAGKLPQVPFTAWADIHESGGIYGREGEAKLQGLPGKPREWFEANFPELALPANLDNTGWWNRPHESEEECQQRAERVWAELIARHKDRDGQPEERVVFVSHGGFFMHLMCAILDLPWRNASHGFKSWFLLSNCSISRIDVHQAEVTVCYLNGTEHLPAGLITG